MQFTAIWATLSTLLGVALGLLGQAWLAKRDHRRRTSADKRARLLDEFAQLDVAAMDLWRALKAPIDAVQEKLEFESKQRRPKLLRPGWDERPWLERIYENQAKLQAKTEDLNMAAARVELDLGYVTWQPYRDLVDRLGAIGTSIRTIAADDSSDAEKLSRVKAEADSFHELVLKLKQAMIHELSALDEQSRQRMP